METLIRTYQLWAGLQRHVLMDTQLCTPQSLAVAFASHYEDIWTANSLSSLECTAAETAQQIHHGRPHRSRTTESKLRESECMSHVSSSHDTCRNYGSHWIIASLTGSHQLLPTPPSRSQTYQSIHAPVAVHPSPISSLLASVVFDHLSNLYQFH